MKKIMLIDDIAIANFIMRKMIGRISDDFQIYEYTSAAEALVDLNQISPDLIFLDLTMPVMDGWEFLEVLKENNLNLPTYILTSSTSELDLKKSRNYNNVKDFLVKPVNETILRSILK